VELLTQPVDVDEARRLLGTGVTMTTATARTPHSPAGELIMFLDDNGHAKGLAANATATALYDTGWTIRGDAVICRADDDPIGYGDLIHVLTRRPAPPTVDTSTVMGAESGRLLHPIRDPSRAIVGAVYADPPAGHPGGGMPGSPPQRPAPPSESNLSL
jgi:hypothetical protein